MDFAFKLKGVAASAATALNRAVQFTEERLGHSDRTEFDGYVENQLERAQQLCTMTSKIVQACEAVVEPNLGSRVEDFLIEKLSVAEKKRERMRNLEWLGQEMVHCGQTFGPGDLYGKALITGGEAQTKLGEMERTFATAVNSDFIKPLKKFLEEDGKNLAREKRILETKRLDLDAAKNKLKKIKPTDANSSVNEQPNKDSEETVKEEVRQTQEAFDKQIELVTGICDKIIGSTSEHAKYLSRFIELQAGYYTSANSYLDDVMNDRIDSKQKEDNPKAGATTFAALGFEK